MTGAEYMAAIQRVDPNGARYLPRDVTGDHIPETWCNFFAHDVCEECQAELPQLKANEQIRWLENEGVAKGWVRCDAVEAKEAAQRGILTLATWANKGGNGHIAVVVPSELDDVCIAQAGRRNFLRGPIAVGFGSLPVRFFTRSTTMEQKPSVGRIVHFAEEGGPYAALIAKVNPDETLELATVGCNSLYFQHGVKFDADGAKGTWRWPPRV